MDKSQDWVAGYADGFGAALAESHQRYESGVKNAYENGKVAGREEGFAAGQRAALERAGIELIQRAVEIEQEG